MCETVGTRLPADAPVRYVDADGRQVRDPLADMRAFFTLYRIGAAAIRNASRIKAPNVSGSTVTRMTNSGVKGWNYVSFGFGGSFDTSRQVLVLRYSTKVSGCL